MILKRSVRNVKKVQADGLWKFVSLARNGNRYIWDERPGPNFWTGRLIAGARTAEGPATWLTRPAI